MGKLREQMKGNLELKGLSPNTQEIYLRQVSQFSRHFKRSPRHLGEKDIKEYLLYLIREKKVSTSTVNQCYHLAHLFHSRSLSLTTRLSKCDFASVPSLRNANGWQQRTVLFRKTLQSVH